MNFAIFEPNGLLIQGMIVITGIAGQFYVAHQNKSGFYWWVVTNVLLLYVSFVKESWGMFLLYVLFSIMCVYSIRKWREMQSAKQPGYKYLDLSTGHVSKSTMEWIEQAKYDGLTIAPYEYGAFLSVPPLDSSVEEFVNNHKFIPDDLVIILLYAASHEYSIIRLDSDGEQSEHLPVFAW